MGISQPNGNNCRNSTLEIILSQRKSQWMVSIKTWYLGNQIIKIHFRAVLRILSSNFDAAKSHYCFHKKPLHGRCLTDSVKPFKKNLWPPFFGWSLTALKLQSHYEETVYFLQLSLRKFLVLIWSTLEGWKAARGFEVGTPGLGSQRPNHWAITPWTWICTYYFLSSLKFNRVWQCFFSESLVYQTIKEDNLNGKIKQHCTEISVMVIRAKTITNPVNSKTSEMLCNTDK